MKPHKTLTYDQYLLYQNPLNREITEHLRALIKKVLPDVTEYISGYANPQYDVNGKNILWIINYKNHVDLGFFKGSSLDSPLLEGTGKNLRHIKVKSMKDIKEREFSDLIEQAVKIS